MADSAPHLMHRHPVGSCRGRGDEVGHSFGLTKVHFAIEIGALCKFPRLGYAATALQEQVHYLFGNIGGAMTGKFYYVFAGIRMWCTENARYRLVNNLPLAVPDASEGKGVAFHGAYGFARNRSEYFFCDTDGLGTGNSDDDNCSSRGSAWCANSFGK